jgi:hypothetical protein
MRRTRLLTLIALLLTLPVYGVAAPAYACAFVGSSHTTAMSQMQMPMQMSMQTPMPCCDPALHHSHSGGDPSHQDGQGAPCQCTDGCGQAQAFVRPYLSIPVFSSLHERAIYPIAALRIADSPQGLWRPPRTL